MNMGTKPDNFDRLLKLLAIKRHEQPPPGYFDRLPGQIIARLRAGEARRSSWLDDLVEEATWLRRVWELFEVKPAVAGLFGAVVSGLLLIGILYSQKIDRPSVAIEPRPPGDSGLLPPGPVIAGDNSGVVLPASSTNPVATVTAPVGLFDGAWPSATRVGWPAGGFVPTPPATHIVPGNPPGAGPQTNATR